MKAIIKIDVPDFQIGQEVNIHFRDSMVAKGVVALSQEPCEDAISRQAAINAVRTGALSTATLYGRTEKGETARKEIERLINALPSVSTEKIGRCKDCKYFERDSVAKVDGIPLIVAHEICSRWGSGCKTREDGYCFLYEPQESEDKE